MFDDLKKKISAMSAAEKKEVALKLILLFVGVFAASLYLFGFFFKNTVGKFTDADRPAIMYGLDFFFPILLFSIIAFILLVVIMYKNRLFNVIKDVDYRNLKFMEDTTAGDARWMNREELEETYTIGNIEDMDVPVYGQITDHGEETIGYKKKTKGASMNQNVLVMAAMGMGKSFGPVRTNILQAVKRGESFVVTDPSGELYSSLAGYCMDQGLKVHVIDLDKPEYSEFWNVLEETINPLTERLESQRLNDFAEIYMKNTGGSEKQDFWYGSALNLIKTIVGYTAWLREDEILQNFIRLYRSVAQVAGDDAVINRMKNSVCSFPWVKDHIRKAAKANGLDMERVEKLMYDIQYVLPTNKYNMTAVFDKLLHFTDIEPNLEKDIESGRVPEMHPAKIAYLMYKTNDTENVRKSALQGAQLRFAIFSDENAKEFLSHDGIHVGDITKEQTAVFVILSDKTQTLKPIASLFFTFLFKDAQDAWDVAAQEATAKGIPNSRKQLTVMLDEFYSIGVIGGSPDAFGTIMSNSRKREIHIWIIVQGYSQLAALYGPEVGNIIQGGCSTLLYLGGNDPDTTDFISSFIGGKASVQSESHQENSGLLSNNVASNTATVSVTQRDMITTGEARRWKNKVLIASQGQYVFRANPFPWIQHPAYLECADHPVSLYEQIKPIPHRLDELAANEVIIDDPETYILKQIKDICGMSANGSYSYPDIDEAEEVEDLDDDIDTSPAPKPNNSKPASNGGGYSRRANIDNGLSENKWAERKPTNGKPKNNGGVGRKTGQSRKNKDDF